MGSASDIQTCIDPPALLIAAPRVLLGSTQSPLCKPQTLHVSPLHWPPCPLVANYSSTSFSGPISSSCSFPWGIPRAQVQLPVPILTSCFSQPPIPILSATSPQVLTAPVFASSSIRAWVHPSTPLTSCVTLGRLLDTPCLSFPTSVIGTVTWGIIIASTASVRMG